MSEESTIKRCALISKGTRLAWSETSVHGGSVEADRLTEVTTLQTSNIALTMCLLDLEVSYDILERDQSVYSWNNDQLRSSLRTILGVRGGRIQVESTSTVYLSCYDSKAYLDYIWSVPEAPPHHTFSTRACCGDIAAKHAHNQAAKFHSLFAKKVPSLRRSSSAVDR